MKPRHDESWIKVNFLQTLRAKRRFNCNTVVASEFALGIHNRRADLALLTDRFIGIEIKSEFDSLARLSAQMDAYRQCFEELILVIHPKHTNAALRLLDEDVEIWRMTPASKFELLRCASEPKKSYAEPSGLLGLLTLAQLRRLVGETKCGGLSRTKLLAAASAVGSEAIYNAAMEAFRHAFRPTSRNFWTAVGNKRIELEHLALLSRFAETRTQAQARKHAQQQFWMRWTEVAQSVFSSQSEIVLRVPQSAQSVSTAGGMAPACR